MRVKAELGLKAAQKPFKGDLWYGMGSSTQSNFSAEKSQRKRPYRSVRFGASVKEWLVCKKMVFLKRKKCHIIYKAFPSTAKALPHVFIHNF